MPAGSLFDLSGRVALVTGASRGIGSAIAETLAEYGASVVLSSRKQADLDAEAERINARYPEKAIALAAHAGRPEELERLVNAVMDRYSRIDILVNNAGTNPYFGPVIGAELAAWDKTFEVFGPAGVGGDGDRLLRVPGVDALGFGVEVPLLAARKNDARPVLGEDAGDRAADPPAGPRD